MGDMFSSRSADTKIVTDNQQVAQQGNGQVGRVDASGGGQVSISVISGDQAAAKLTQGIALEALQDMAMGANINGQVALAGLHVASKGIDMADHVATAGLTVANNAVNDSHQSIIYTLEALQNSQNRSLSTVDRAVGTALDIAKNAAPVSPGAYAEFVGANANDTVKTFLKIGLGVAIIVAVVIIFKKSN